MEDKKQLMARIRELSERAYQRDIPQHTPFLGVSEQAAFLAQEKSFREAGWLLYGGHPEAERQMLFFLPEYLSEERSGWRRRETAAGQENGREAGEDFAALCPGLFAVLSEAIACVRLSPVNERFAEALSHRDYLGALMNLGIERDVTGDILQEGKTAYLYCTSEIAETICTELVSVRHTAVRCVQIGLSEAFRIAPRLEALSVNVPSERLDAVIAAVFRLSRGTAAELCAQEKVFLDGRIVSQPGRSIPAGVRVSVRGYGKFLYDGMTHETKKGRLYVTVRKFI